MIQEQLSRIPGKHGEGNPTLIVAWTHEVGGIASDVIEYLDQALRLEPIGEIDPVGYFPLDGVQLENDIIQFPESTLFSLPSAQNIIILHSNPPSNDHYRFLNSILDFTQGNRQIKEIYTIGAIVSASAHMSPRQVFGVVNQSELKIDLATYGVELNVEYRTPKDNMPTLSSFLLWIAKRRGIPGCGLWVNIPFYLSTITDPIASKCMLELLDRKFELGLDFGGLELEIAKLNQDMEQLMRQNSDINRFIQMLERGIALTEDEREKLTQETTEFLLNTDS